MFERNFGWFCNPSKFYEEHGTKERMIPLYPRDNYARYTLECVSFKPMFEAFLAHAAKCSSPPFVFEDFVERLRHNTLNRTGPMPCRSSFLLRRHFRVGYEWVVHEDKGVLVTISLCCIWFCSILVQLFEFFSCHVAHPWNSRNLL